MRDKPKIVIEGVKRRLRTYSLVYLSKEFSWWLTMLFLGMFIEGYILQGRYVIALLIPLGLAAIFGTLSVGIFGPLKNTEKNKLIKLGIND